MKKVNQKRDIKNEERYILESENDRTGTFRKNPKKIPIRQMKQLEKIRS